MELAYGKTPHGYNDPDVLAVNRCLTRVGINVCPGRWKVDIFPILRYVTGYLKELQDGHKEELTLSKDQLSQVQQKIVRLQSSYYFIITQHVCRTKTPQCHPLLPNTS
jgi:hypothetical protein